MASIRKVRIPEGVKVKLEGTQLLVTGPKGQLARSVRFPQVTVTSDGKEIVIATESNRKETTAMVGTFEAHAKNMCRGVSEGFEYRMKVVYSHFPIQLKLQGNRLEIANFLGEKKARYADITEGVTAKVANDEVGTHRHRPRKGRKYCGKYRTRNPYPLPGPPGLPGRHLHGTEGLN